MRRKAKHQEEMQDEYAKIKNRLKNMDIELHTEVRASLCCCQELKLQQDVQLVHVSAVAYDWLCKDKACSYMSGSTHIPWPSHGYE